MEVSMKCWSMSPELELLLSLALRKEGIVIPKGLDWVKFEELAGHHRLHPLVAEGIKKLPPEVVEKQTVLKKIYHSKNRYAHFCMRQMQHLACIARAFEQAGIPMLSFKGPILAMELYGNPALRYSRDLDLLVAEADFTEACRQLELLGYKEIPSLMNKTPLRRKRTEKKGEELHRVYQKQDIVVELHWRLSFRVKESFDALWENHRTKILFDQQVHYSGYYDNIEYLISHAAGHAFNRLRWLLDIYELQKSGAFFWDDVYKQAKEHKVGALVIETWLILHLIPVFEMKSSDFKLFMQGKQWNPVSNQSEIMQEKQYSFVSDQPKSGPGANHMLKITYDACIQKEVEKGCQLAELVYALVIDEKSLKSLANSKYIALLPTMGKKRNRFDVIAAVFEPRYVEYELIDLPDSLFFLYYLIRPVHIIWKKLPFSKYISKKKS